VANAILRFPQVVEITGLPRSTIYAKLADDNFPRPIKLGERSVGWVESEQLGAGVYYLTGGSHHSVAVEFNDFVAVVEEPQNQARALAVIQEVYQLFPNKPIHYVVNTYHHFDHLGGVRTFFYEGATIVAHATNRNFYKQEVLSYAPWTLEPDLLPLHPPTKFAEGYQLETVDIKSAITDGTRALEVYYVQSNPHSEGMLMALYEKVIAYGLNPSTIAPLHGRTVPWSEFLGFIGQAE